ncbi:hypothetical protein IBX73_08040 [candidate division WOR-3 bacterium]|nr:hypothetical protein [candidate division WOR-3 bacterium]
MTIIIYEERPEQLYPLTNLVAQFSVRVGMMTFAEHTALFLRVREIGRVGRPMFGFKPVRPRAPVVYLSSRLLVTGKFALPGTDTVLQVGADKAGLVKTAPPFPVTMEQMGDALMTVKRSRQVSGIWVNHPWDLIAHNAEITGLQFSRRRRKTGGACRADVRGDRKNLFIDKSARVHKQVFLDVTEGPVYIDAGAEVLPFTSIIGPSHIGSDTVIDRAKIAKSSIGPQCRISGEVEACIFQGYSNKHHEGFIGHSFVGEWVNLGALTTNSDLKNNYGPVRMIIGGREVDTGMTKLGCFIGDHAKLGIGTLIPTGAVVGSFVNFAAGGMMDKYTADFTWVVAGRHEMYDLDKAVTTARHVMHRRNVKMSCEYEQMIRSLHGSIRCRN